MGRETASLLEECRLLWKDLLGIPDSFDILLTGGGAPVQHLMVPVNLLEKGAAYLDTGERSRAAMKEAKGIGRTVSVNCCSDIPSDVDYFHITTHDTDGGVSIPENFNCPVTLVADMTGDILDKPFRINRYGIIYAGFEGISVVIIRKDITGKVTRYIPTLLNYNSYMGNATPVDAPASCTVKSMLETLQGQNQTKQK